MIKIKLYETDLHRNECTFRPYWNAQNLLRDVGIDITDGDSYDYAWIGQASITDKKVSLNESAEKGLEFLSKISGDYMIVDGQDSTSLIGTYEVFKESNALLLLKNSLLKDRNLYKDPSVSGRFYWKEGNYKLEDFDKYSEKIVLSGTNWPGIHWAALSMEERLQRVGPWMWIFDYNRPKPYDVCAMYQYPSTGPNFEYNIRLDTHYDKFRKGSIDVIDAIEHSNRYSKGRMSNTKYNVAKLTNGIRVSRKEYTRRCASSKIFLAPFGNGETAPRDIASAILGAILIKPNMNYIETVPHIFKENETYIACKHDYSDLEEKIESVIGNYKNYYHIVENLRKEIIDQCAPEKLASHVFNILQHVGISRS